MHFLESVIAQSCLLAKVLGYLHYLPYQQLKQLPTTLQKDIQNSRTKVDSHFRQTIVLHYYWKRRNVLTIISLETFSLRFFQRFHFLGVLQDNIPVEILHIIQSQHGSDILGLCLSFPWIVRFLSMSDSLLFEQLKTCLSTHKSVVI